MMRTTVTLLAMMLMPTAATSVPLEEDAIFNNGWTRTHAQTLANEASALIVRAGYRCDSVASIRSWLTRPGFTVTCNGYRYHYEIEDRGGRWTVTVK